MIEYNIDLMTEIKNTCSSANNDIAEAVQLLMQVKSHNDWTCKEKKAIDTQMDYIKKQVETMSDDSARFLEAVDSVREELTRTEESISKLYQSVEGILAEIISIPVLGGHTWGVGSIVGSILQGNTGATAPHIPTIVMGTPPYHSSSSIAMDALAEIPVCRFADIKSAMDSGAAVIGSVVK